MVLNIRGTNGSGKSHLVHRLLKEYGAIPLGDGKKINAYRLENTNVYIVGRYETPTGGCDTIIDINDVNKYIKALAKRGHVVFEGLVATGIAGRWIELARSMPRIKWIFLTLDTPLKKCIRRVEERRRARGELKPMSSAGAAKMRDAREGTLLARARDAGIDPRNVNIVAKAQAVRTSHLFLGKEGMDVRYINHERAYEIIKDLLGLVSMESSSSESEDPSADEHTIQRKFEKFHIRHPEVRDELVRRARLAKDEGRTHYGIGALWEELRYNFPLEYRSGDSRKFKFSNNYRSRYARLIRREEPDLRDFFKIRPLKRS
jgi:hypothetical protein